MSAASSSSTRDSLPGDLRVAGDATEEETGAPEDLDVGDDDKLDDRTGGRPAGMSKLKGWARGVREDEVLKKHIEPYRQARQMGTRDAEDYVQMVCNEYRYRIPYDLPDSEEPQQPLREWTPTTPPDDDSHLSQEERKKKEAWIVWMMPRIKRWLDYRAQGGTHVTPATGKKLDPTDPINIMLFQIADTLPAHRVRQGWQQFWHEEAQTTIEDEVARLWPNSAERKAVLAKNKEKEATGKGKGKGKGTANPKPTGAYRQSMARALFAKKTKAEQKPYLDRAAAEKARDTAAFDAAMKAWPPKDPVAIQVAIDNLAPTIGRFMQGVADLTNMHVVMALGGPSPRFHGHYILCSENNAPSPVAFPDWDAAHFNTHTLEKMKSYLRTAYSPEECMASALPEHMCIGSREDAWASLRQGPATPANLDEVGLIRMSPAPEYGDKRKKQKTAASSGESDDDAAVVLDGESGDEEVPRDGESGDESEGEARGKRKRKAGNSSGKGKKARGEGNAGQDEAQGTNTRKQKGGLPRPLPRRAYRKPDVPAAQSLAKPAGETEPASEEAGADDSERSSPPPTPEDINDEPASPPPAPDDIDGDKRPSESVGMEGDGKDEDLEDAEAGKDEESAEVSKSAVTCPQDASKWLQEVWAEIAGVYVTRSYSGLLQVFIEFERAHGWSDGERSLSATGRPKQVKDWIRYEEEFWIWWKVLQPQWRRAKIDWPAMDAVQTGNEGESWATLRVPGKNGLVSVVASLYWWGREGVLKESVAAEWSSAVRDVTWALRRMAASAENPS
ncbi:hypothetical protein C8F01DRAFT_1267285 [Mycena amicta]|nr:hypothetical protein C8F01DRAFT_1267285 [Mycena amicta]